jgi:hypothetical protein
MIKSRIIKRVGHVELGEGGEMDTGFMWGNLKQRDQLENRDKDGSVKKVKQSLYRP